MVYGSNTKRPLLNINNLFESVLVEDNIKKIHMSNNQFHEIKDFGVYNYFSYSDTVKKSKMTAAIYDDIYVIDTGLSGQIDHRQMHNDIEEKFGEFNCFFASDGDGSIIYAKDTLSVDKINVLISMLNELKLYYLKTGRDKLILVIGDVFKNDFSNNKSCKDIDSIIKVLVKLKEERLYNYTSNKTYLKVKANY